MKKHLSVLVLLPVVLNAQASFASEPSPTPTEERPRVQFVHRSTFFGLNPIDIPINPKSNEITDTVKLIGGAQNDQTWQITGSNSAFEWIRRTATRSGSNHPNENIVQLFARSGKATEELRAADAAASSEDRFEGWGLGLAAVAGLSLGLASSTSGSNMTSNPLFYGGVGLGLGSLVSGVMMVRERFETREHLRQAVGAWNAGE